MPRTIPRLAKIPHNSNKSTLSFQKFNLYQPFCDLINHDLKENNPGYEVHNHDHLALSRLHHWWRIATLNFNAGPSTSVTVRTIQQNIIDRDTRVPLLTARHKALRLVWARQHPHLTIDDWKHVAWSDESRFQLNRIDGRVRVWRQSHESMDPTCQQETVQAGGGFVMVWGVCSWRDMGPLIRLDTTLTGTSVTRAIGGGSRNFELQSSDLSRHLTLQHLADNKKIELAKLQLAKLEKEIELQLAKNKALSLNPAAKVEEKQFETNIENMIKSIKTLSLPVPTRSENFNLFFQSLERAFLTKKINDEYKSEILINLLGERAHNVLLYIKEEELNDYEKLKSIVLREFQLTPRECLNSFKNAVKSSGETYIQFAARLTANFQYYYSLRKVNSFESLCDLIISDKLFETLNKETATHIGIREAEDWFRPIDLAKECDIYISSRSGSHKETPITYGYTQDPFKNKSQNFKTKIKENYPQYHERENKNCYICGDSSHCARDCEKRFKPKESNDHIHNKINVNTLKVESEKQNSDKCANLQYVNIFVENQPVTALIDSGVARSQF
ncbi:DUF1758 domain-containing protein [Trichonephila clavipes]|nr:DUF1758 domain-containing protein [Trichonephila clavipes]